MVKIEFIPCIKIQVRHQYTPSLETANKNYPISLQTNSPIMKLILDKKGNYFLIGGISTYDSAKVMDTEKPFPCYIETKEISEPDWLLEILKACFLENAYWKVKYDYLMLLLNKYRFTVNEIVNLTGIKKAEVSKYCIDEKVPNLFKNQAIENNKQIIVNEICRNLKISESDRIVLYKSVFHKANRLTDEKYKLFKLFFRFGYRLNSNILIAEKQLTHVLNKDKAMNQYWASLKLDNYIPPDNQIEESQIH
jgi:hypothetical protein